MDINMLGATEQRQLVVASLAKGTTLTCATRLDLALFGSPEHDIYCRRVNYFRIRWSAVNKVSSRELLLNSIIGPAELKKTGNLPSVIELAIVDFPCHNGGDGRSDPCQRH